MVDTKTKLLQISDVGHTAASQYIRTMSFIQWLMYTEFMKIDEQGIQGAIKNGHGRPRKGYGYF